MATLSSVRSELPAIQCRIGYPNLSRLLSPDSDADDILNSCDFKNVPLYPLLKRDYTFTSLQGALLNPKGWGVVKVPDSLKTDLQAIRGEKNSVKQVDKLHVREQFDDVCPFLELMLISQLH